MNRLKATAWAWPDPCHISVNTKQSVPPPPRTVASLFPQTRTYMRQVLEGIGYLHQSHVLHLDVKVSRRVASMWEVGRPYRVPFLNQLPCLGYSRRTC